MRISGHLPTITGIQRGFSMMHSGFLMASMLGINRGLVGIDQIDGFVISGSGFVISGSGSVAQ